MAHQKYWDKGTPSEQLMEECAEVIQAVCKSLRFGWHNYHPNDPEKTPNYKLVEDELNDLTTRIHEFQLWLPVITSRVANKAIHEVKS